MARAVQVPVGVRRVSVLLLLVLVVVVGLVASGVLRVHLDIRPPSGAEARPFWAEKSEPKRLPDALGIWIEIARAVRPAVVNISTTSRVKSPLGEDVFRRLLEGGAPRPRTALGSGFIVSGDGYIVTNFHVVQEAAQIVVRLSDGGERPARLVGTDPKTDLALVKIDGGGLPTLPFGDSDRLEVGEPVLAIGAPFGLEQTVTNGIVSAKERFIGAGPYDDFIQTDASVNPGNSGGPLVDARGALVGINSAIFSQTGAWAGISFAIPVNLAKQVLPQLRERGKVTRGYLGVSLAPITPDLARELGLETTRGALVAEVGAGSPAGRAGIEPGDVIVAFQGEATGSPRDLTRRVSVAAPGTTARIDVLRRGHQRTVEVRLGELPESAAASPR